MNNNKADCSRIQAGFYQHYKGQYYQVLAVAQHSEEQAPYVVYRALYGDFGLWVRPLAMFCEQVETANGMQPRFTLVRAHSDDSAILTPLSQLC